MQKAKLKADERFRTLECAFCHALKVFLDDQRRVLHRERWPKSLRLLMPDAFFPRFLVLKCSVRSRILTLALCQCIPALVSHLGRSAAIMKPTGQRRTSFLENRSWSGGGPVGTSERRSSCRTERWNGRIPGPWAFLLRQSTIAIVSFQGSSSRRMT